MRPLLAVLMLLFVVGCGVGENLGDDARAQQARDAKALSDLYAAVVGRWTGILKNEMSGLQPTAAELTLYKIFVNDGSNPDGSQRLRPSLRGRFRPVDVVSETDDLTLIGDYDRNGHLVLTSIGAQGGAGGAGGGASGAATEVLLSIEGGAIGNALNVQVARRGGIWGTFEAKRVSTDPSAPTAGDTTEQRNRRLRIFKQVEGQYQGILRTGDGADRMVEISLIVNQAMTPDGVLMPTLTGFYRYLDVVPGTLDWALTVDYNSQTGDIFMRDTGGVSTAPGGATLSLAGRVFERAGKQVLDVAVRNKSRVVGSVQATRGQTPAIR